MYKISLNERIFVAGANGMAGSAICRALKNANYGNDKYSGLLLTPNRAELDLTNTIKVSEWFKENKPTVVIVAAAKVGGIYANSRYPVNFLLDNLKIQTNLIENAWKNGVKRLLFLGSSCIYPKFAKQPLKEEYLLDGKLEETNEPYAIAKITGIKLCQALNIQYDFDAISLMPTNLYGPGDNYHPQNSHVMASLIRKFCNAISNNEESVTCWGTGSPMREFLHVDDLGEAVLFCLRHWDTKSNNSPKDNRGNPLHFLNIGTGIDLTIKDLAKKIAEISNYKGKIIWDTTKPDGTPRKKLDITHIKSLGWESKINLDDGIIKTIENYRNL